MLATEVRILLIEDNPGDVHLIRKNLDMLGAKYQMKVLPDGEQALNYIQELDTDPQLWPHIVFLDLNLPRVNGRDVLAKWKSDARLHHIPVVVLSSSRQPADIEAVYGSNANCFVEKPGDMDEYYRVVKMLWDFWHHTAVLPAGVA